MRSAKGFLLGINRTFSSKGGIMWQSLSDSQLRELIMKELESFWGAENADSKGKKQL